MLGNRLKILRELKNLTQKQVSEELKISEARYNQYETNRRNPDYELLKDIATFYQVSIDYLLGNEKFSKEIEKEALEREILMEVLVNNGYMNKGEDISNKELERLIKFIKQNKDFIRNAK